MSCRQVKPKEQHREQPAGRRTHSERGGGEGRAQRWEGRRPGGRPGGALSNSVIPEAHKTSTSILDFLIVE